MMNICKNCQWSRELEFNNKIVCDSPSNPKKVNPVTGDIQAIITFCEVHRGMDNDGLCGTEGRWFEPKEQA